MNTVAPPPGPPAEIGVYPPSAGRPPSAQIFGDSLTWRNCPSLGHTSFPGKPPANGWWQRCPTQDNSEGCPRSSAYPKVPAGPVKSFAYLFIQDIVLRIHSMSGSVWSGCVLMNETDMVPSLSVNKETDITEIHTTYICYHRTGCDERGRTYPHVDSEGRSL